ncbi:MAG TPA: nicotinate (nicotinamide) nucleotide adenylyltransferase [Fibrobacteria bacterium]|jgi:nicotinate-nucleotide adenylyltransferase|nr:nicotinate (nicotinamide) nucleotide adenylyltransferase [Fibrobacteria bacterium]
MRIGVLGGTFDPPHAAHAALARAAREQLGLDRVLWVPALSPPHKGSPAAAYEDRLAMARALAAEDSASEVSDVEGSLPSPSYTLRTLEALKAVHGEGHGWHLILGADNWEGFPRWHRPEAVLAAARPAVYPRKGYPLRDLPPGAAVLNFPEMPEQSTAYREWLARDREGALAALPASVADCIRARNLYLSKASA